MTFALPSRKDVESAAARVEEKVRRTPAVVVHRDEVGIPARVVLKLELVQHTGSFKARGALNSVMSQDSTARAFLWQRLRVLAEPGAWRSLDRSSATTHRWRCHREA